MQMQSIKFPKKLIGLLSIKLPYVHCAFYCQSETDVTPSENKDPVLLNRNLLFRIRVKRVKLYLLPPK